MLTILPRLGSRAAIALIYSCVLPLTGWAADDSAKLSSLVDAAIRPLMAEYDVPGMAVAVTVDGRTSVFNYGVASRENNTPVGDATLFELGSISKTFTGMLAGYAQALGKLSLEDHPGKYMPELKGRAIDNASLLNLGTYTAGGLPLQFPDEVEDNDQMISGYFERWKADAAPGAQRRYSNPSIGLLGHIAALSLNSGFADAVETRLFPQLGLNSSYIRVPESAMPNYAWGYNKANKAIRVNPGAFAAEAYGAKSTASDMIRFVQANIEPGRLDGPIQRAVEGTHVGHFEVGHMVQGLGWEQYAYPVSLERLQSGNSYAMLMEANAAKRRAPARAPSGPTLFNKTGSTNGFASYIAFVPAKKIGVVILANRNYPIPARIKAAHAILEQLAPTTE